MSSLDPSKPHPDHVGADDDGEQGQAVAHEVKLGDDGRPENGLVVMPSLARDVLLDVAPLVDAGLER